MKSSSGTNRRKRVFFCSSVILFFLCIGGGIFLFQKQGSSLSPTVSIQRPENGRLVEVNQILPTFISATFDNGGISRVELYADGALIGSQDTSLPGGDNPLVMAQAWMPLTTGRHLLMARAYDLDHKFYDSSVIFINVVNKLSDTVTIKMSDIPLGLNASLPSLTDISLASGTSLDTLRSLNPELGDLSESAPLPNDASITVPYSPAPPPENTVPNPAPLPGTPASPQITNVEAASCNTVQLSWNDVSDESGYTVYRLINGESMFSAVAQLGADTSSYTDAISQYGDYLYQVGSDKDGPESLGNVASVSTPDSCEPPAPEGTTNLTVSFLSLTALQRFDGIYCYSSINDSPFRRIPQYDFQVMEPRIDGLTYDLQTQLSSFGQLILPAQSTSSSVALTLECWGRLGAESTPLGVIHSSHGSSEWDERNLTESASDIAFQYRIDQNSHTTRPVNIALTPGISGQPLDLPSGFNHIPDPTIPSPTNVRDIRPVVGLCNALQSIGITTTPCTQMRWHGWDGIAWDWSDPSGRHTEHTLTGYRIKVNQLDMQDPHNLILTTLTEFNIHPGTTKSVPPPAILNNVGCGTLVQIHVQAVSGWSESEYSDPLVIAGPPCTGNNLITITVNRIIVGDGSNPESVIDTDPCILCADRRLELYGSLLFSPIGGRILDGPTGHNGPEFGGCPDHTDCTSGFTHRFEAPDYRNRMVWNMLLHDRQAPGPGQTLTLIADLYDYDYFTYLTSFGPGAVLPHFSNDPASYQWCQARLTIAGRTALEWERFDDYFYLRDHNPQGACDITIHIQSTIH
ncbi:MAG: Ig-like domain-containing protein [Chloroflexi bacterium]|nr:Ig-like domain-containing protein [Chloroflexota bacterium]